VCIASDLQETKSNPNPNPTTKLHAVVSIQLNIVTSFTRPTYTEKFIRDNFESIYKLTVL